MTILIAGASGATGRLLVQQLLDHGLDVRAIVRSPDSLSDTFKNNGHLTIIHAGILDMAQGVTH
ncbi:MAG: NAD(P)H-binding protein [Desulfobacteraceae bacterium]